MWGRTLYLCLSLLYSIVDISFEFRYKATISGTITMIEFQSLYYDISLSIDGFEVYKLISIRSFVETPKVGILIKCEWGEAGYQRTMYTGKDHPRVNQ